MKRASVYLHDYKAGTLTEDENGYTFCMIKIFWNLLTRKQSV